MALGDMNDLGERLTLSNFASKPDKHFLFKPEKGELRYHFLSLLEVLFEAPAGSTWSKLHEFIYLVFLQLSVQQTCRSCLVCIGHLLIKNLGNRTLLHLFRFNYSSNSLKWRHHKIQVKDFYTLYIQCIQKMLRRFMKFNTYFF